MKKFYFVGGPVLGQSEEFFRRLEQFGGTPAAWSIYPHADDDGKALHIAEVESRDAILEHLRQFQDIYEWGEIVEVLDAPERQVDVQGGAER